MRRPRLIFAKDRTVTNMENDCKVSIVNRLSRAHNRPFGFQVRLGQESYGISWKLFYMPLLNC